MKSASAALDAHIQGEVTTLCTCWKIVRLDGTEFYFTNLDINVEYPIGSGTVYLTSVGLSKTNASQDSSLGVPNTEIVGIFDSASLSQSDLLNGLFNYATIFSFLLNYSDLTQGEIKLSKARFGEVTITDTGVFTVEQRGMSQALKQKNMVDVYGVECPVDLGGVKCGIDLIPTMVWRSTPYEVGDLVRSTTANDGILGATLQVQAETDLNDETPNNAIATIGGQAARTTVTTKVGAGAIEFTPSGSDDPSVSFVGYPHIAAYGIGTKTFVVEGYIRFKDLSSSEQVIASVYLNTGGQRGWILQRNAANLEFIGYSDGASVGVTITEAATWAIDTWYHIAVSRDASGDMRMFLGGTQLGSTTNYTGAIFDSTGVLYLGKRRSSGFSDDPLDGFIDQFRFGVGDPVYVSNFTPSVTAFPTFTKEEDVPLEDFNRRDYICTVGGTTSLVQPTYDTVIGNPTVDGGVTFSARLATFVKAQVVSVTNNRKFKVSEITPAADNPDGAFNAGGIMWLGGDNLGAVSEVKFYLADDGITIEQEIELYIAPSFTIQVGDTFGIYRGCDKTIGVCRDTWDNVENFRGFPHIPGPGFIGTQVPDAKQ